MRHQVVIFVLFGIFASSYGAGGSVGGSGSGKSSSQGQGADSEATKRLIVSKNMTLFCKIDHDAGEKLSITWSKDATPIASTDPHYEMLGNLSLLIKNTTEKDVGEYVCQTVDYTPPKSFSVSVVILSYRSMQKSKTVMEGEKFSLVCDAEGTPKPNITWLKDMDNVEDAINNTRYSLWPNVHQVPNANITFESAINEDRAVYACFITSGDLQYNTTIYVRVKNLSAALWPFLGICAEVFVLCLIIFIYEKRRAKADFEESDTDQPTEQKNTSDNSKDTVRQRK